MTSIKLDINNEVCWYLAHNLALFLLGASFHYQVPVELCLTNPQQSLKGYFWSDRPPKIIIMPSAGWTEHKAAEW